MFDESLELTGSGVTNSSDDRVVTRADRTTVPITTVFGRFKDMPISSAEADFTAHTYADLRGSTRRVSYFPINNRSHNFDFCPSNANVPTNGAITLNSAVAINIEVIGGRSIAACRISPAYMDLGDCNYQCRHCGGLFWYNECLKRWQYSRHPEYHLCYARGKFYMHPTPDPPTFIQQLLGNSHFMENIRAYN
nr:helitron helicase-like domain-containing protein [Tanacetum cinerariifolium]